MRVIKPRARHQVKVVYFFFRLEYDSHRNLDSTPELAADHSLSSLKSLMINQKRLKEKSTTSRFVILNQNKALIASRGQLTFRSTTNSFPKNLQSP